MSSARQPYEVVIKAFDDTGFHEETRTVLALNDMDAIVRVTRELTKEGVSPIHFISVRTEEDWADDETRWNLDG